MINNLLYICGAPGVGKSTVARELTAGWDRELVRHHSVPHSRLLHPASRKLLGLELGVPREQFPGTDALAMDIGPRAQQFLSTSYVPFAFGEGARLATQPFLFGLASQGVRTTLVQLTAAEELLEARWHERGAKQNTSWRKGAATRAQRLAERFTSHLAQAGFYQFVRLNVTDLSPAEAADRIRDAFPLIDLRESAA